jgi:hypothetical protein
MAISFQSSIEIACRADARQTVQIDFERGISSKTHTRQKQSSTAKIDIGTIDQHSVRNKA